MMRFEGAFCGEPGPCAQDAEIADEDMDLPVLGDLNQMTLGFQEVPDRKLILS